MASRSARAPPYVGDIILGEPTNMMCLDVFRCHLLILCCLWILWIVVCLVPRVSHCISIDANGPSCSSQPCDKESCFCPGRVAPVWPVKLEPAWTVNGHYVTNSQYLHPIKTHSMSQANCTGHSSMPKRTYDDVWCVPEESEEKALSLQRGTFFGLVAEESMVGCGARWFFDLLITSVDEW